MKNEWVCTDSFATSENMLVFGWFAFLCALEKKKTSVLSKNWVIMNQETQKRIDTLAVSLYYNKVSHIIQ